jgi:sec-independent protein translocase protein TatC
MGDEVPDEGAADAPDSEPDEETEPSAHDADPATSPAGTDTDADVDAGGDSDDASDHDDGADGGGEESGRSGADDGPTGSPVLDAFGDTDRGSRDEEAPDDGDGRGDTADADADVGSEAHEDAGDEGSGSDSGEIPEDYDPLQPPVDIDRDANQSPSAADDAEDDRDAEDDGDTEEVDGSTADDDPDEEWVADDALPMVEAEAAMDAGTDSEDASAAKSDGGYAGGTDPVGEYEVPTDDGGLFEGPPGDQEMPLADHIEEMVRRLGVVIVVMAVVSGIVFPFGDRIINFLWYSVLVSNPVPQPRVYHPLALILARLKVATLAGFIVALPVFVYESYLFMRPGLYPNERRYYLASVPTSLVLATVGVLFAYFLVLPGLFTYFLYYSDEVTVIAFGLTETFDLIVLMMGGFAIIFQIPLFVMLAIMMGLTTRQWMADRRLYFWGAFLGLAFLFSPDPTGMAPIIVAATMVALFEGTLFLLKWTDRGRRQVRGG